jgi:glutamate synthase (NADPH) large chain
MAQMGFRTFDEMIGRADMLETRRGISQWKARGLDFSKIFYRPQVDADVALYCKEKQDHGLDKALDHHLIAQALPALERQEPVRIEVSVRNTNRTVGAMLSGEVARRFGHAGLPEDTIYIRARGTAGQSFGAFLAQGVAIELEGEANDYVGKGLSGGRIAIYPPADCPIVPEENIIVGNTVMYGAISGECYFRGVAGERFAVRNSGASAVVEGVGDHGCEYMTGGVVVVLGMAGRNFAAGMSGGIAFVLDESGDFERRCNMAMVELEPVPDEEHASDEMRTELESHGKVKFNQLAQTDDALLKGLIEKHLHFTGSARARKILAEWSDYLPKFVKVMPVEYRRALQELADTQKLQQQSAALLSHG